jgi:hypothetical protein
MAIGEDMGVGESTGLRMDEEDGDVIGAEVAQWG